MKNLGKIIIMILFVVAYFSCQEMVGSTNPPTPNFNGSYRTIMGSNGDTVTLAFNNADKTMNLYETGKYDLLKTYTYTNDLEDFHFVFQSCQVIGSGACVENTGEKSTYSYTHSVIGGKKTLRLENKSGGSLFRDLIADFTEIENPGEKLNLTGKWTGSNIIAVFDDETKKITVQDTQNNRVIAYTLDYNILGDFITTKVTACTVTVASARGDDCDTLGETEYLSYTINSSQSEIHFVFKNGNSPLPTDFTLNKQSNSANGISSVLTGTWDFINSKGLSLTIDNTSKTAELLENSYRVGYQDFTYKLISVPTNPPKNYIQFTRTKCAPLVGYICPSSNEFNYLIEEKNNSGNQGLKLTYVSQSNFGPQETFFLGKDIKSKTQVDTSAPYGLNANMQTRSKQKSNNTKIHYRLNFNKNTWQMSKFNENTKDMLLYEFTPKIAKNLFIVQNMTVYDMKTGKSSSSSPNIVYTLQTGNVGGINTLNFKNINTALFGDDVNMVQSQNGDFIQNNYNPCGYFTTCNPHFTFVGDEVIYDMPYPVGDKLHFLPSDLVSRPKYPYSPYRFIIRGLFSSAMYYVVGVFKDGIYNTNVNNINVDGFWDDSPIFFKNKTFLVFQPIKTKVAISHKYEGKGPYPPTLEEVVPGYSIGQYELKIQFSKGAFLKIKYNCGNTEVGPFLSFVDWGNSVPYSTLSYKEGYFPVVFYPVTDYWFSFCLLNSNSLKGYTKK